MAGPADPERPEERGTQPASPPSEEQELARGRAEGTPASLISWVTLAVAVPAALAILTALLVYVLV